MTQSGNQRKANAETGLSQPSSTVILTLGYTMSLPSLYYELPTLLKRTRSQPFDYFPQAQT